MSPPDNDTSKRAWNLFLRIEVVLLVAAILATWSDITYREAWLAVPVVVLWAWLVVTLPICVLYLISGLLVMTLSPLIPTAVSRALRRELKSRPAWSDDEFYDRFYAAPGISKETTIRVRHCLFSEFDRLTERAVPADPLYLLLDDLDYEDVLHRVGRACGVKFTSADYPAVDGTLDNLIRMIHARLKQ